MTVECVVVINTEVLPIHNQCFETHLLIKVRNMPKLEPQHPALDLVYHPSFFSESWLKCVKEASFELNLHKDLFVLLKQNAEIYLFF